MKNITYSTERPLAAAELASIFRRARLNRRIDDAGYMQKMAARYDLLVTAWDGELLVGVSRSLTDFCHCCYLSDLAVDAEYQRSGIGEQLVELTRRALEPECRLLLLAAPTATTYYPKIGFAPIENGFIQCIPTPQT